MYDLKIYDNEKKEVILEIRSNSLKQLFDYLLPFATSRYQILIKTGDSK